MAKNHSSDQQNFECKPKQNQNKKILSLRCANPLEKKENGIWEIYKYVKIKPHTPK